MTKRTFPAPLVVMLMDGQPIISIGSMLIWKIWPVLNGQIQPTPTFVYGGVEAKPTLQFFYSNGTLYRLLFQHVRMEEVVLTQALIQYCYNDSYPKAPDRKEYQEAHWMTLFEGEYRCRRDKFARAKSRKIALTKALRNKATKPSASFRAACWYTYWNWLGRPIPSNFDVTVAADFDPVTIHVLPTEAADRA